ncbi:Type I Iterative PKS, partial [Apiospora marii]
MEPQAIIGVSFRLPGGVVDDDSLWEVLESGRNLSTEWPPERAAIASFTSGEAGVFNKLPTSKGHFVEGDPAAFDAPFFAIPPNVAAAMDPQQRWILEAAYHAFENAGISMEILKGSRTAVFTASMADDYTRLLAKDPDTMPRTAITGTSPSILANRVSWFFDLAGPSMHVDSACSSSLTALDLAVQTVQSGNASQALVVGSSIMLSPESSLLLSNMSFLSPDGVCHSFDHGANGYARGEGVVALLIKPISSAVADGDAIRAVIRSIGSNQDGHTASLTQPSAESQERLIREVYAKADLGFDSTLYVEAHGTGTVVGDPLEIEGIASVFGRHRTGSIKSNIGHLEGGSGLAGVLKSILMLEKSIIPSNALFKQLNPDIARKGRPVVVPTRSVPWPGKEGPRRISVNSFGFGGSNCHVVLDEASYYLRHRKYGTALEKTSPASWPSWEPSSNPVSVACGYQVNGTHGKTAELKQTEAPTGATYMLVWSANDEAAAKRMLQSYEAYYKSHISGNDDKLAALALTLSSRRSVMQWRAFAVANAAEDPSSKPLFIMSQPMRASLGGNIAMVFTGEGANYASMGVALLVYPAFENVLKQADGALRSFGCSWSIFEELFNVEHIHLPQYSQPLCTALQIALLSLLTSLGVSPVAVIGHSSGEIAAAYAAGALSLDSAMKVAFYRGLSARKHQLGSSAREAMMSVNISEDEVASYLHDVRDVQLGRNIHIACVNSPANVTLSGSEEAIDALKQHCDQDNTFVAKINTMVAYHSPSMLNVREEYRAHIGPLTRGAGHGTGAIMISSVTGAQVSAKTLCTADYWVENLTSPVRLADAVASMFGGMLDQTLGIDAVTDVIEVGPHAALQRYLKDTLAHDFAEVNPPRLHSVLRKPKSALETTLALAGELFCLGHPISVIQANRQSSLGREKQLTPALLVDCPKYPFDRSRTYWTESRVSRNYRLRLPTPADSLGTRASDWNPLEPRWRSFLSVEEMPWIGDHVLNDQALFPGAGMLLMATEAARQVVPPDRRVLGFHIKEAHFLNPILVNDKIAEATEVATHLRQMNSQFDKQSTWSEIVIYAFQREHWSKCFTATVQVQLEEVKPQADTERERRLELERITQAHRDDEASCIKSVLASEFYKHCEDNGFKYGHAFQTLDDIRWDGRRAAVARVKTGSAGGWTQSLLHPASLDAAFQLSLTQVSAGLSQSMETMVPHQLTDTWFSTTGRGHSSSSPLRVSSQVCKSSGRQAEAAIHVLAEDGTPLCTFGKLVISSISRATKPQELEREQRLIHRINWKPQLSMLSPQQLQTLCDEAHVARDEQPMVEFYERLESALLRAVQSAMSGLSEVELRHCPVHLQKLVSAMHRQVTRRAGLGRVDDEGVEELLSQSEKEKPSWAIFSVVARELQAILKGKTDALDLVYGSDLAEMFYKSIFDHLCDDRFRVFMDLLYHETPAMRIIEIGAGTGGLTRHVLSCLDAIEQTRGTTAYSAYDYTDISPSFFENAKAEFAGQRMSFQVFDVEADPSDQLGSKAGTYDLVVAGGVLHATKSLEKTLRNARKLLKEGGRLVLVEITAPESLCASVGFGVLPGWWLSQEDYRAFSPAICEEQWSAVLAETGFSGNDLVLRDYQSDSCHFSSVLVSTAVPLGDTIGQKAQTSGSYVLVVDGDSGMQSTLATSLSLILGTCRIINLRDLHQLQLTVDETVISLLEAGQPLLATISEGSFKSVQHMIGEANKVVWITWTGCLDPEYAHYNVSLGLLRTVRAEAIEKQIITLAVESEDPLEADTLSTYISRVLESHESVEHPDTEFVVRGGHLTTGRLAEDVEIDEQVEAMVSPRLRRMPLDSNVPLQLSVGTPGMLDTLQFIEDPSTIPDLGAGEVEVEAKAWALSFRDIFVAIGRLQGSDLGWDCAGVVRRVGPGCSLVPGERVCLGAPGSMRTHVRASSASVFPIPEGTSFEDAASWVNPGCTSYHCLVNVAQLQRGEKILIHSAAGATGQMALWLAKHCGAEIYATVGTEAKRQLLIERFGIAPGNIFSSRNTAFAQGIKRLTGGYGVDVVLNSLSGDGLKASWDCIAPYGRFVEIGKADIVSNSSLSMANFQRNVSFFAVDLHHLALTRTDIMSGIMRKVLDLVSQKVLDYPFPRHVFPVGDVEGAFRSMQSGTLAGRIVIQVEHAGDVPTFGHHKPRWSLDPNASYLVVGGLGGLGRAIAAWLAKKGAKYLVLLSRSGIKSKMAHTAVEQLRGQGVTVATPACDVSSSASLRDTLSQLEHTMPPIKGSINAAMALHDGLFENLTHEEWDLTMRSKVATSVHLDNLLPRHLDFFVLLSSLSGLYGSISLSSYAAGCTFQDALAESRSARGERAVSLDIGWMKTIGIIAETQQYQRNRERARDMRPIEDDELLALLDLCCNPSSPYNQPGDRGNSQILIGATTPAFFLRRGEQPIPQVRGRVFSSLATVLEEKQPAYHNARGGTAADEHAASFQRAKDPAERTVAAVKAISEKLARTLSMPTDDIEAERALTDYGVDSLMAVELRNWFINDFQAKLAVFDIMGNTSIAAVGEL